MFFDLSIPFGDVAANGESTTKTLTRRRSVARAMELGYSGVAYDRQFRGVMSDLDRCRIPHLSLDSLVGISPALISSTSFHRGLVGAPKSSPFRQYTRITVAVDRLSVGTAFNAKSVLRSYDLVAARPGDQEGFNQACKVSEVDIIALDFPLKFRLKLPMVEAAIKRGVHFEITYSNLVSDDHRNKMLSDARLLVDLTRGKNLILSSSAASVNEIRGPYDIVNLASFLLGLSMERAKAAISANCRSLIGNALRKKDYKEAIRIERIPDKQQLDWLKEWNDWDPISSGQHDLLPLDDKLEPFSTPTKLPRSFSAIDFLSRDNGFSLKDQVYGLREDLPRISNKETVVAAAMKIPSVNGSEVAGDKHKKIPVEGLISVDQMPPELQVSLHGSDLIPPISIPSLTADSKEGSLAVNVDGNLENPTRNTMLSNAMGLRSDDIQLERCTFQHEVNLAPLIDSGPKHVASVINLEQPMEDPEKSDCANVVPDMVENRNVGRESVDCILNVAGGLLSTSSYTFFPTPLVVEAPKLQITTVVEGEQKERELSSGIPMNMDFVGPPSEEREESGPLLDDVTLPDDVMKEQDQRGERGPGAGEMAEPSLPKTGKRKRKARSNPAYPLPFKSLLKPSLSKKKACQSRKQRSHL